MFDKERVLSRLSLMKEHIEGIEKMLEQSVPNNEPKIYKPIIIDETRNNTSNGVKIGEITRYRLSKLLTQRVWSE